MLSRVADSLYWMSRYLERAEHTARLLDVQLDLLLDQSPVQGAQRWERLLTALNVPQPEVYDAYEITRYLTYQGDEINSILSCIAAARENARQVREQISSEMWEQLNRQYLHLKSTHLDEVWEEQPHKFFFDIREQIHLFRGITGDTMNYDQGWHFIQVGRFLERAMNTSALLDAHYRVFFQPETQAGIAENYLEWVALLKSCTSFESYCKVYSAELDPVSIAEFLLLNRTNSRSICFCTHMIQSALKEIGEAIKTRDASPLYRLTGRMTANLDFTQIEEVVHGNLSHYLANIEEECIQIHTALYRTYIEYVIERDFVV